MIYKVNKKGKRDTPCWFQPVGSIRPCRKFILNNKKLIVE